MKIETQRLILRPIIENDDVELFDSCKSKNVGPNAGWKPHDDIDETREIMKLLFLGKESVFGIEIKDSGQLIGTIGLIADPKRENNKAQMLGYAIGDKFWGNGYATEASKALIEFGFCELKLDLISVYCYSFNERSKRVIEKCGFEHEGKLRLAEKRYDGEVFDNECYSIVRP